MDSNRSIVPVKIDENCWIMQIKEYLKVIEIEEEEEELRVSIFNVSKDLLALNPKAYIPQTVSIGPCHHSRSELYDMERHKLTAARRFQKSTNGRKFETVVEEFKRHDYEIRSCYQKFNDYKEETFAWLMALDAAFLLDCLQFYVRCTDVSWHMEFKQLARVLEMNCTVAAQNAIIKDLMMLENQLPLFLLQKLLELQFEGSKSKAEEKLRRLLRVVCQELSPFTFKLPEYSELHVDERGHVLEVLYYSIVPFCSDQNPNPIEQESDAPDPPDAADISTIIRTFSLLWKVLSSLNVGPIRFVTSLPRRALKSRPLQFVMKLPLRDFLTILEKIPVLNVFNSRLGFLINQDAAQTKEKGEIEESSVNIIYPTTEELAIPSVAALCFAGVEFCLADGDPSAIRFDEKTATLYLPQVRLDTNTEVIMKNLVAFEASAEPGALVFRRYIDFMNGLIDCGEDVRLLREKGIISNHLQNDQAVSSLWNSMGKYVELTKVAYLDKIVEDLNRYYKSKWKVIVVEFANKRLFNSWKILSLIAAAILLLLTCLEAFCSVYDCREWSIHPSKLLNHET